MSRAVASFTVAAEGIRLRVRLLATMHEVDAAFRGASRPRRDGKVVPAFFHPATRGATAGTIVLAADAKLEELVPHEVTHAVVTALKGVHTDDDERAATAVGLLTTRIHARIRKQGLRS